MTVQLAARALSVLVHAKTEMKACVVLADTRYPDGSNNLGRCHATEKDGGPEVPLGARARACRTQLSVQVDEPAGSPSCEVEMQAVESGS